MRASRSRRRLVHEREACKERAQQRHLPLAALLGDPVGATIPRLFPANYGTQQAAGTAVLGHRRTLRGLCCPRITQRQPCPSTAARLLKRTSAAPTTPAPRKSRSPCSRRASPSSASTSRCTSRTTTAA